VPASETSALQKSFSVIPANDVRHDHVRSIQDARKQFNANLALTGQRHEVRRYAAGCHQSVGCRREASVGVSNCRCERK